MAGMRSRSLLALGVMAMFLGVTTAGASEVSFGLSLEFSGATAPAGVAPWLTATFEDGAAAGTVNLTLESNLVGNEFVREWYFNLDPALDVDALQFDVTAKSCTFSDPAVQLGRAAFMADGDGHFDILLVFDHAPPSARFGAGCVIEYTITGDASLTAASFDFLSQPGGGASPPIPTAAHVQGIGPQEESGWVTVPEPATMALLAVGGLVVLWRRRHR